MTEKSYTNLVYLAELFGEVYAPISVPNVCSEHPETASLYLLFLALFEVFGDFRRQIRIQHVELL